MSKMDKRDRSLLDDVGKGQRNYEMFVDKQMASLGLSMSDFEAATRAAFPAGDQGKNKNKSAEQMTLLVEERACGAEGGDSTSPRISDDEEDEEGEEEGEEGDEYDMDDGFLVDDDEE